MDLTRPVRYRSLQLNDVALESGRRLLTGISLERADYSQVQAVGYVEKRAESDGMHASDVYLGPRQIDLSGMIYADSPATLFDTLRLLRITFTPTSAYQDDPVNKGFVPLYYSQPTKDLQSFPSGEINLFIRARPLGLPRWDITRDRLLGVPNGRPQAMPWNVSLMAKDPRVYIDPAQEQQLSGTYAGQRFEAKNRGDYESPLNILLVIGNTAPTAPGRFTIRELGGVEMSITIEAKANVIYRWRGNDRTLHTQENTPGAPEALRMDLVNFVGRMRKLMVPAKIEPEQRPFVSPYNISCNVPLAAGSRLFWNEAFA
jgi:hypothetical protein